MRFSLIVMLASAYARASLGGTFEVIDIDNQCAIWSYDNHGCTGSSAFFSQLDGDDCSKLDKVANSTHPGYPMRGVEACGTEDNSSAAWVKIEKPGVITFFNFQGDNSTCALDNELKHGSRCTASNPGSTQSSFTESSSESSSSKPTSTEPSSTQSSSTESSSTKSSSALTTLDSSSSALEPSSTTFQTAPISDCSAIG